MGSVRRALDDLTEGMRSLFGAGDSRPALVDELLSDPGPGRTPRRAQPPRRAALRRRAPARHLARVK